MPTLHLHVGHPKTATTYLQHTLHLNEDHLGARGLWVPSDFTSLKFHDFKRLSAMSRTHSGNASYLFFALANPSVLKLVDVDRYWRLVFEPAGGRDLFLSSELLFYAPETVFEAIRGQCAHHGYDLHLIAYVQRQDRAVISGYVQNVRNHGYAGSPFEYLDLTRRAMYFCYAAVLERMRRVLQPARWDVRVFEPQFLVGRDIWSDLASLGLPILAEAPARPSKAINEGLNIVAVELLRTANRLVAGGGLDGETFARLRSRLLESPAAAANKASTHQYLYDAALRSLLQKLFAEDNAALAQAYFADDPARRRYWENYAEPGPALALPVPPEELASLMELVLGAAAQVEPAARPAGRVRES